MVNYNNSVIYKLCSKDINVKEIYVGSTANELRKRKNSHKSDCNNVNRPNYNSNVYKFIRDNGGWDNWDMIIIEKFECNDKLELHKQERYWLEELKATLNSQIPNRSMKEHYKANKDKIKEYYEENKKKKLEKLKEYYEKNKQEIKEKTKEYYENNKDKRNEKNKEKVKCDICNKILSRSSLNRHIKNLH